MEISLEILHKSGRELRLRMAGHCVRQPELAASNLVLWEPTQGRASRGGQSLTFIDQLLRDTSLKTAADIRTCMEDRDVWRVIVARGNSTRRGIRPTSHSHPLPRKHRVASRDGRR